MSARDACDNCGKRAELYHNEATGLAFCDACDAAHPEPEPELLEEAAGLLSTSDLATLNAARTILHRLDEAAFRAGVLADDTSRLAAWNHGLVATRAKVAAAAVFDAIVTVNVYGGLELTEAQLHNRPDTGQVEA